MPKAANGTVDTRGIRKGATSSGTARKFIKKQAASKQVKTLHPNSRKAARLQRGVLRQDKLTLVKRHVDKKKLKHGERLLWFQDALTPGKEVYAYAEICEMIQHYIARNDEELQAIKEETEMRGRPPTGGRGDLLLATKKAESEELRVGFKLPDFRIAKIVKQFSDWELELNLIPRFNTGLFKVVD